MDWINLAWDKYVWPAVVNMVMNMKCRQCPDYVTAIFSRSAVQWS